jgi:hypothetical protein
VSFLKWFYLKPQTREFTQKVFIPVKLLRPKLALYRNKLDRLSYDHFYTCFVGKAGGLLLEWSLVRGGIENFLIF